MERFRSGKHASAAAKSEHVTKEFVRIYYGILNNHPEQLFQFYGNDSMVIVSEFSAGAASSFTESADTKEGIQQLLKTVYTGVTCRVKTALPQFTVEGGVLLLVSGTLTKAASSSDNVVEHYFTQALVLAPQKNGYYVLNDTLHIMGNFANAEAAQAKSEIKESTGFTGRFYPQTSGGCSIVPMTPRPQGPLFQPISTKQRSTSSDGDPAGAEIKTDSESDDSSEQTPKMSMPKLSEQPHSIQKPRGMKPYKAVPAASGGPNGIPVRVSVGVPPPRAASAHVKSKGPSTEPRGMAQPEGHGVFIARLPFGIQAQDVENAFSVFGPIINGADGIQVRDGRNGCYAFVTFESRAAAREAIEKGAVVQGKRAFVEPRYLRPEPTDVALTLTLPPPPPPQAPTPLPLRLASPLMCQQPHLPN